MGTAGEELREHRGRRHHPRGAREEQPRHAGQRQQRPVEAHEHARAYGVVERHARDDRGPGRMADRGARRLV